MRHQYYLSERQFNFRITALPLIYSNYKCKHVRINLLTACSTHNQI